MGKEILHDDSGFEISKPNRRANQEAERGRQRIHFPELLLEREIDKKVTQRKQRLQERRLRNK